MILRGPAGSGKTTISEALVERIGKDDACILDLDITGTDEQKFNEKLEKCLSYDNAIGMMFYGNSHTTDPTKWIVRFKDNGFVILSVILLSSKDVCVDRCINDTNTGRHPINKEKDRISKYHDEFYQRERNNPFHISANVKEIEIESENKSPIEIAENILEGFDTIFSPSTGTSSHCKRSKVNHPL